MGRHRRAVVHPRRIFVCPAATSILGNSVSLPRGEGAITHNLNLWGVLCHDSLKSGLSTESPSGIRCRAWKLAVASDKSASSADTAAFRLDFEGGTGWLLTLRTEKCSTEDWSHRQSPERTKAAQ